ncbi:MAG: hypothetical protein ACLT38_04075 [Akkermansia sp.]
MKLKDMVGGITAPRLNELIEQTIRCNRRDWLRQPLRGAEDG